MRREVFLVVATLGIAACGSPAAQKDKDPKAPALEPAVVDVPLTVPTAKMPEPAKPSIIPEDQVARSSRVLQSYSLITATVVNHDLRMLAENFEQNAVFHGPDSTIKGSRAIAQYLVNLGRAKSLADWQRISHGQRIVDDSTLLDSGLYRMILKRTPKDSTIENGRYRATWRARKDINLWAILEDEIMPGAVPKKKGAK